RAGDRRPRGRPRARRPARRVRPGRRDAPPRARPRAGPPRPRSESRPPRVARPTAPPPVPRRPARPGVPHSRRRRAAVPAAPRAPAGHPPLDEPTRGGARRVARRGVLVKDASPGDELRRLGLTPRLTRRSAAIAFGWAPALRLGS